MDIEAVKPFRNQLDKHIKKEGLHLNQLSNFDEMGLNWRVLPENSQVSKSDKTNLEGRLAKKVCLHYSVQMLTEVRC